MEKPLITALIENREEVDEVLEQQDLKNLPRIIDENIEEIARLSALVQEGKLNEQDQDIFHNLIKETDRMAKRRAMLEAKYFPEKKDSPDEKDS